VKAVVATVVVAFAVILLEELFSWWYLRRRRTVVESRPDIGTITVGAWPARRIVITLVDAEDARAFVRGVRVQDFGALNVAHFDVARRRRPMPALIPWRCNRCNRLRWWHGSCRPCTREALERASNRALREAKHDFIRQRRDELAAKLHRDVQRARSEYDDGA